MKANHTSANVGRFRGRLLSDVVAYCSALLKRREAEGRASAEELEPAAMFDEAQTSAGQVKHARGYRIR